MAKKKPKQNKSKSKQTNKKEEVIRLSSTPITGVLLKGGKVNRDIQENITRRQR